MAERKKTEMGFNLLLQTLKESKQSMSRKLGSYF